MSLSRRDFLTRLSAAAVAAVAGGAKIPAAIAATAQAQEDQEMPRQVLEPVHKVEVAGRRGLLVNGKPFVPTFAWWVAPEHFEKLAGAGVNTALSPMANPHYIQEAQKAGLYVGANPHPKLAGHPQLLSWMQEDEPDIRIKGGPRLVMNPDGFPGQAKAEVEPGVLIERVLPQLREREQACRAQGDQRPIFLNFSYLLMDRFWGPEGVSRPLYTAMSQTGDILSWDIYPIAAGGRVDWLPLIWEGTDRLRSFSPDKPVFVFLECVKISHHKAARDPSEEEMRNQVWQAIAAGATGIGWFTFGPELANKSPGVPEEKTSFAKRSFSVGPENQQAMARINGEIQRRTELICAPELCRAVRWGKDGLVEVAVSLRQEGERLHWIAVNPRLQPAKISWRENLRVLPAPGVRPDTIDAAIGRLPTQAMNDLSSLEVRIVEV
ncbi:MAG: twin-arginine translocation signal domain-containing protein [Phycisphaeraceae bacterium]|nr:twin-arginine translocation signal domain-containing protein [Phycisphaeraceae bacterium]